MSTTRPTTNILLTMSRVQWHTLLTMSRVLWSKRLHLIETQFYSITDYDVKTCPLKTLPQRNRHGYDRRKRGEGEDEESIYATNTCRADLMIKRPTIRYREPLVGCCSWQRDDDDDDIDTVQFTTSCERESAKMGTWHTSQNTAYR
jgi:hypothetical protein